MTDRAALAAVLALAAAVFGLSLANGFVWDDADLVVAIDAYARFDLAAIVKGTAHPLEYLPVRDLSLAMDMQLWGLRPLGFHLTSLLLYLAGLAALYAAVRELAIIGGYERPGLPARWTTLVFALHPLHAEVENFITSRNTLLAGLFVFLSLWAVTRGLRQGRPLLVAVSFACFLLACFSKAIVVFFPVFLPVVFLYLPREEAPRVRKWLVLAGFLVLAAFAAWVHVSKAMDTAIMNDEIFRFGVGNPWLTLAKAVQIPLFYLRMILLPWPLNVDYDVSFTTGALLARSVLAAALLVAAMVSAWMLRRRAPLVTLGVAWFLASLVPVLNIFPTTPVVADRYAYLAIAGFGMIFAHLLTLPAVRRTALIPLALVLLLWAVADLVRTLDWRSDLTLWSAAVAENPNAARINLAHALWMDGRVDEAILHLREERNRSGTHYASLYEGLLLTRSGRTDDAIASFRRALAEGGDAYRDVHLFLAQAYESKGEGQKALEHYLKSLEARSIHAHGRYEREAREGAERIRSRHAPRIAALRARADEAPAEIGAQVEAALFLHALGLYEEAARYYRAALALDSARWDLWYNQALTQMRRRQYAEALQAFETAARLNPQDVNVLNNLGICAAHLRQFARARQAYARALELSPGFVYAAFNLGRLHFSAGEAAESRAAFEKARALAAGDPELQRRIDQYLKKLGQG